MSEDRTVSGGSFACCLTVASERIIMDQQKYKVAVIMSSYNGERYIEEQIESILHQVGVEVSLFIRDDGSTDKTPYILRKYASENRVAVTYARGKDNTG